MILVDTDVLIEVSRGAEVAVNCLQEIEARNSLTISVVTQMELVVGCRNKLELQELEKFLRRFQLYKLNEPITDLAVDLLMRFRLSHGLLIADALIAATALSFNLPLVSRNQRDYRFIPQLELLPYPHPFAS